jgi:putative nucleotidyltransferase with HDIG domain
LATSAPCLGKKKLSMWKIIENYQWDTIKQRFEWIRDMQNVPQDPIFHAEGDVETHTRMVLEALLELEEFKALQEQDQHLLIAAALLHDVEKRSTTVTESDGRITSKGHARKGKLTSRRILYLDVPTPFQIREQIVKLVRYHGLPLWVFEKEDPRKVALF